MRVTEGVGHVRKAAPDADCNSREVHEDQQCETQQTCEGMIAAVHLTGDK